jgi:hypothetical protein
MQHPVQRGGSEATSAACEIEGHLPITRLYRPSDFDRFVQLQRDSGSLPIHIDDRPAITMSALRTRCGRLKRTKVLPRSARMPPPGRSTCRRSWRSGFRHSQDGPTRGVGKE